MAVVPQKTRRERSMFAESDDSTMMKLIQATHHPDDREISVKPLLQIVEHIFLCATHAPGITNFVQHQEAQLDELKEKVLQNDSHKMMDMLSYTISKISQMSSNCYGGGDAHATTMEILNLVSSYSWDAKVVLALAGFAVTYGEFWLVTQLYLPNPLVKAVQFLQQSSDIIARAEDLKPKFEAITNLIRAMTDVAQCIVEFKELPSQYITPTEMLTHTPTAVYWTVRSIVACTSQIAGLTGMGHEYTALTAEASELPMLADKLKPCLKQDAVVPQKTRRERSMFAESDDSTMVKLIQATHDPDGREFSVKPLLQIVEHIFLCATHATGITNFVQHQEAHQAKFDELDDKVLQSGFQKIMDMLSYTIFKISCQMSSKCYGGGDAHETTMEIFNLVSNYSWDAKVVLALAAFAVTYGEFWLVTQLYLPNPLVKAVQFLQQSPDIIARAEDLKPEFEEVTILIRNMTDVATCIVKFKALPSQNKTPREMSTATALIPTAVYWTIRSIVACTSQIAGLIGMGHEYTASTTEAWGLSSLAHKVSNLTEQLTLCYQQIDERREMEAYLALVRLLRSFHIDNMEILKALIYAKDEQLPLFQGSTKKRVGLDLLRRKTVLLLISDLELSHDELTLLKQMYSKVPEKPGRADSQYEIVWLPVVDISTPCDEKKKNQYETLQSMMPWYSVHRTSLLDVAVIRYIKEVWHFNKKALLVVLDPQGKVVNPNAIHMVWIWGSLAFPFTSSREEALWKQETWKMELLVDRIDSLVLSWIKEGKFICLYGGEDIEWIRKFTKAAKVVAGDAGIQLEMVYLGKSGPKEKAGKISAVILKEKLGHVFSNLDLIWLFWVRLESMWHSKVQQKRSVKNDLIMQEIMTMLSFDGSDQGWAVISKGSDEMAKARGDTILKSFAEFESWKQSAGEKGFLPALIDNVHKLHSPTHCNRLILPEATGSVPERIVCAECNRPMEKFIMYRCCTD
ncbi:hypothetical protein SADUNF_Sadunf08G0151100 [Salix dunnii]|uniref:Sieve element occlusion n=1 Tax=Salix dunnii TaxID=1413687 RepID=A0A835MUE5_9ROSI|nr:hypothetical protein SADUNF_Sadunf08G0151100 [Salix dunnii]